MSVTLFLFYRDGNEENHIFQTLLCFTIKLLQLQSQQKLLSKISFTKRPLNLSDIKGHAVKRLCLIICHFDKTTKFFFYSFFLSFCSTQNLELLLPCLQKNFSDIPNVLNCSGAEGRTYRPKLDKQIDGIAAKKHCSSHTVNRSVLGTICLLLLALLLSRKQ